MNFHFPSTVAKKGRRMVINMKRSSTRPTTEHFNFTVSDRSSPIKDYTGRPRIAQNHASTKQLHWEIKTSTTENTTKKAVYKLLKACHLYQFMSFHMAHTLYL